MDNEINCPMAEEHGRMLATLQERTEKTATAVNALSSLANQLETIARALSDIHTDNRTVIQTLVDSKKADRVINVLFVAILGVALLMGQSGRFGVGANFSTPSGGLSIGKNAEAQTK